MNSNKLKGKIVEKGMTQGKLAGMMGITLQSLNAKINKRTPLSVEEAQMIIRILEIDNPIEIFFADCVPNKQQGNEIPYTQH